MTVVRAATASPSSLGLVWRNRSLRRLDLALLVSTVGDGAYATALAVYAFQWGGPGALGAYVAVKLALKALAVPVLVTLTDRLSRTTVLATLDGVRAVLVAVVAVLVLTGAPPPGVLVAAVATGLVGAPYRAVAAALTPSLVSTPRELAAANSLASTVEGLAAAVGPALGGLLLAATSVPVVVLLDAVTFAGSAVLVLGVHAPATGRARLTPRPGAPGAPGFAAGSVAGFRTVWGDRRLRLVTGLTCLQTVVAGAGTVFTVVVALHLVHLGEPGVGYLTALLGVGAVVGGLLALGRSRWTTLAADLGVGVLLSALPVVVLGLAPDPGVAFVTFVVLGVGNPLVFVNLTTLLQRLAPPQLLGPVLAAVESVTRASLALGALAVPLLVAALGPAWALVALGAPVAAVALLCAPALRRLDHGLRPPPLLGLVAAQPLFAGLPPAAQELVATRLRRVDAPAGTRVIEAGEQGDTFYLVASGRLEAVRRGTVLTAMGAGDCFGEIALLRDVPRTVDVVAVDDAVLHALARTDFLQAVGADPETAARADLLVRTRIDR